MWLDNRRGHLTDWSTQRWVQLTGRRIALADCPWLDGLAGEPSGIGASFFQHYAAQHGLRLERRRTRGLLEDFSRLNGAHCDTRLVSPGVVRFYERTSEYDIDAWSHWRGAFRPFGWALAVIFSRRLQQLNVPLTGLDTSRGMMSDVLRLEDPASGEHVASAWVRQLRGTGRVIYSGAYSTCEVPGYQGRCVRVVFPLPNGNAVVIMRPISNADGSLSLVSAGERFGCPGFYFTVRSGEGTIWARYVRTMRETIHVYEDGTEVRADHILTIWGMTSCACTTACEAVRTWPAVSLRPGRSANLLGPDRVDTDRINLPGQRFAQIAYY